jgi:hypothetical protein
MCHHLLASLANLAFLAYRRLPILSLSWFVCSLAKSLFPIATMQPAAAFMMALLAAPILASPAPMPMPTPAPSPKEVEAALAKRTATCTFSGTAGYSSAIKSKASCDTIILKSLTVPGGNVPAECPKFMVLN